jgi:hypothetical protein
MAADFDDPESPLLGGNREEPPFVHVDLAAAEKKDYPPWQQL